VCCLLLTRGWIDIKHINIVSDLAKKNFLKIQWVGCFVAGIRVNQFWGLWYQFHSDARREGLGSGREMTATLEQVSHVSSLSTSM